MRSRFQIINALSVCLTCVSAVSATEEPGFVGLPIGTIEIVNHEVFDEPATGVAAPYRIANTVHIRTRDEVVGRELLFETGDLLTKSSWNRRSGISAGCHLSVMLESTP